VRIPLVVWGVLALGLLSAAALFFFLQPGADSSGGGKQAVAEVEQPLEPIHGWLEIQAESPVPPSQIEIFREGAILVRMDSPGFVSKHGGDFSFPPTGATLGVYARWDDHLPGPRAVRFSAIFEGTEISSFVLWGNDDEESGNWRLPIIELAGPEEEINSSQGQEGSLGE
jgi:hypothetical protein